MKFGVFVFLSLFLSGCDEKFRVTSGDVLEDVAPSAVTSTILGSDMILADGATTSNITITLLDADSNPVIGVTPIFGATDTGVDNIYGACSVTDALGISSCTLASSTAETKTLQITSPVIKADGAVDFFLSTSITTGLAHTCALLTNGRLKCWGWNDYGVRGGMLGDGTDVDRLIPVDVMLDATNVLTNATSVAGGFYHTCASIDGGVKCWGINDTGQIGLALATPFSLYPVDVIAAGSNVSAVAAGEQSYSTCALILGQAKCWGWNGYGNLGNNSIVDSYLPVDVIGLTNASQLSVGGVHACALDNGGVKCWGWNFYGQIGDNTTADRHVPTVAIAELSGVIKVSAGYDHTCAVIGSGLKCWGNNSDGQLGDGTIIQKNAPTIIFANGSNVTDVAAGLYFTCAVIDGGLQCWGSNSSGQLGDGTIVDSSIPLSVYPSGSGVTSVAAGDEHVCAILSGRVKCWGYNSSGQQGDNSLALKLVPGDVLGL